MHLKLAVILVVAVKYMSATDEGFSEDDVTDIKVGNLTDVYYKGSKLAKGKNHCTNKICLNKCCPFGTAYYPEESKCSNITKSFGPYLHDEYLRLQKDNAIDIFYFKIYEPVCQEGEVLFQILLFARNLHQEFRLRTDGNLYVDVPSNIPPWMVVSPDHYCIDNFVTVNPDGTKTTEVDALVCFQQDQDENFYLLSSTCMLISCVFILATVGVYTWLPQLHNIHGRVLVAYLLCLFVGFIFMATMQLLLRTGSMTAEACMTMTFIIYFSLLSAFFWLNVMCFDIWRVFSGKRELRLEKLFVRSKLRAYALYAFGIPTVLTILLITLEFFGPPLNPWMPMLRHQGCFLSGKSKLIYLYVPIVILCVANMTLFILTALKIAKTKKEISALKTNDSSRHDPQNNDKQRLFLYVKLFIVMGINWILEVLSALFPSKYWQYTDAYNVLIGFTIFIIFVCKRKIIQLLKERYKALRREPVSHSTTSWSRATLSKDEMALTTQ